MRIPSMGNRPHSMEIYFMRIGYDLNFGRYLITISELHDGKITLTIV